MIGITNASTGLASAKAYANYGWAAEANINYFWQFNLMDTTADGYFALETHSESWAQNGQHIKVLKNGLYSISGNILASPWSSTQRNTYCTIYTSTGNGQQMRSSGNGAVVTLSGAFTCLMNAGDIVYAVYQSTQKCTVNETGATNQEWVRATFLNVTLLEDYS